MALKEDRASGAERIPRRGVIHEGVRPRKVPPKAWPSNKPPGGKRLEPPTTTDKQS